MPFEFDSSAKYYRLVERDNPKDRVEIEVGDAQDSTTLFPQVKIKRWDNEVNASIRLKHDNIPGNITYSDDGTKITWQKRQGQDIWKAVFYHRDDVVDGGFEFEVHLPKKPPVNYLEFTVNTKDLDWLYQPALTQQEIDEGVERSEDVVGSYAVYHKYKGALNLASGKDYKRGKAFHVYRPHVIDAGGNETWGVLELDELNGILKISVDQTWLNNAIYPVIVDPTFGYTSVGGSASSPNLDNVTGAIFALSENGDISQMSAAMYTNTGTINTKTLIYNVSSNYPSSLVATSSPTVVDTVVEFKTYTISTSLSTGSYFLAGVADGFLRFRFDTDTSVFSYSRSGASFYTTPPNPYGGTQPDIDRKWSIYATYSTGTVSNDSRGAITKGSTITSDNRSTKTSGKALISDNRSAKIQGIPTRIWHSGLELNSLTNGVEFRQTSANTSIVTSPVRSGSYALRVNPSNSSGSVRTVYAGVYGESGERGNYYFRLYIRLASNPTSANNPIVWIKSWDGNGFTSIDVNEDRTLTLWDDWNSASLGSSSTLDLDTWYNIELRADDTTSSATILDARINGVTFVHTTRDFSTFGGVDAQGIVDWGTFASSKTLDYYLDDLAITKDGWPGEGHIIHLRPNGTGTYNTDWTGDFTDVDEITPDDTTTFISSNTTNHQEYYSLTNPEIDLASKIKVISAGVRFRGAGASSNARFDVGIYSAVTDSGQTSSHITPSSTTWITNESADKQIYPITLYDRPNASKVPWSVSELRVAEIFFKLDLSSTNAVNVSTTWLLVEYEDNSNQSVREAKVSGKQTDNSSRAATISGMSGEFSFLQASGDTTDTNQYTFSSQNLGSADPGRYIIVSAVARKATAGFTLSSLTVGGVSARIVVQNTNTATNSDTAALAIANVPTGTTGDIVVTWSTTVLRCAINVWRVVGLANDTEYDSDSSVASDPSVNLDVPIGFAVGAGISAAASSALWTGLTENSDSTLETFVTQTAASSTFSSPETGRLITIDFASSTETVGVFASWEFSQGTETSDSRPAKIFGKQSDNNSRSAIISGKQVDSDVRSAKLLGKVTTSDNRSAVINGNATTNENRSSKISGEALSSDNRSAIITGKSVTSENRPAKTYGKDEISDIRDAIIYGSNVEANNRNTITHGKATTSNNRSATIYGKESADDNRSSITEGVEATTDNRSAKVLGKVEDSNSRSAKVLGQQIISIDLVEVIFSEVVASDSRDVITKGIETLTNNRSAVTSGKASANDNRSAIIYGEVTVSDFRSARTHGQASADDSRDAVTKGNQDTSDTRDSIIKGVETLTSSRDSILYGDATDSNSRNAITKGVQSLTDNRPAKTYGKQSADDNRSAVTKGIQTLSSSRNAFTIGTSGTESARDAKTAGVDTDNDSRSAYTEGALGAEDSRNAITKGVQVLASDRLAKIIGYITLSDSRNAIIKGNASVTDSRGAISEGIASVDDTRSAKISGYIVDFSLRNARISGTLGANDSRNAIIKGRITSSSSRNAIIKGLEVTSSNRNAKVDGLLSIDDNRSAIIKGKATADDSRDAKTLGVEVVSNSKDAIIVGVNRSSSSINATTQGQTSASDARGATLAGVFTSPITGLDVEHGTGRGKSIIDVEVSGSGLIIVNQVEGLAKPFGLETPAKGMIFVNSFEEKGRITNVEIE